MSEPIFVINQKLFNNTAMTTSFNSAIIDIAEVIGYAVHSIWTGAPTGSLTINGSNDGINFVPVATISTGGTSGQNLTNVQHEHYRYVQISYIFSSGTGALTCYLSGKRE